MTFLAFNQRMSPGERETRNPVVKFNSLPGVFMVAGFALLPLLAFVLVILFVARIAIRLQLVLVEIALMAADTFRFLVFAQ